MEVLCFGIMKRRHESDTSVHAGRSGVRGVRFRHMVSGNIRA